MGLVELSLVSCSFVNIKQITRRKYMNITEKCAFKAALNQPKVFHFVIQL